MTLSEHIFRAYDIRGLFNEDLTPGIMLDIGLAVGSYVKEELNGSNVIVGNDIRDSSIPLVHAFISGVITTGVDITYVGTTAFGQTLFKGWELKKDAIAFITASHLPPEWNGIKFYYSDGVGFPEEELMKIKNRCFKKDFIGVGWKGIGSVSYSDAKESYQEYFKKKMKYKKKLKIAVDCGGASTAMSAPDVISNLGLELVPVFCEPDPSFSSRPSDPKPENLVKLKQVVVEKKCDFGVAFDGDGDRAVIVDDKGRVLSADQTGIILGKYGLDKKEGTIVANVECSKAIEEQLEALGFGIKRIPVGHTFLTLEAKKEKSPLGIESSGHLILPEFFLFDDALVIPLKIAKILDENNKKLSDMVDEIPIYPLRKAKAKCPDEIKFNVMKEFQTKMIREYEKVNTMDGVRIDLQEGWVLIRPSNTSPIIRITVEADNEEVLESIMDKFKSKLEEEIEKYQE